MRKEKKLFQFQSQRSFSLECVCSRSGKEEILCCSYEKSWMFQFIFYGRSDHKWYKPLGLAGCLGMKEGRQESRMPGRKEGRQGRRKVVRQEWRQAERQAGRKGGRKEGRKSKSYILFAVSGKSFKFSSHLYVFTFMCIIYLPSWISFAGFSTLNKLYYCNKNNNCQCRRLLTALNWYLSSVKCYCSGNQLNL